MRKEKPSGSGHSYWVKTETMMAMQSVNTVIGN
jgi:hypothetical protein